jgi:hypothetical protein
MVCEKYAISFDLDGRRRRRCNLFRLLKQTTKSLESQKQLVLSRVSKSTVCKNQQICVDLEQNLLF